MSRPAPPDQRPGLRSSLAAFRYRNFTLFWSGALVSNTGVWVQNITIPFVVFQLTHSPTWVGFAAFAQLFGAWLTGAPGGSLADRHQRRTVLLLTQTAMAADAFVLWAYWVAGGRSPWVIVLLSFVSGIIAGLNIGAWQAFVSELVPREALLNAVTLNSTQFNASRAFGPAVGGLVLAALGPSWSFLINALSYAAVIGALLAVRVEPRAVTAERQRILADLAGTFRYVRRMPGLLTCVLVVLTLGAFGGPLFSLLVVFAEEVFDVSEGQFGVLGAALGVGAILGTPFVAGWGAGLRRSRLLGIALIAYGGALVAFALAPIYEVAVLALVVAGAGYLAIASTLNTTIQLQVDESMRGKVLSFYVMGLTLTLPLGSLVQGWTAEMVGPRETVVVAGVLFLGANAYLYARGLLPAVDDEPAGGLVTEPAVAEPADAATPA